MPKINALVEGQTEETFIRDVLNPYLLRTMPDLYVHAIIIQTKRVNAGGVWRGGVTKYRQFRDNARRLASDKSASMLTSVIDLYHLPRDFPGFDESRMLPLRQRVAHLENALREDIACETFEPYISTHEFEALVLAKPEVLSEVLGATRAEIASFCQDLSMYSSPEHINGEKGPANRIMSAFPNYDKLRHGPISTTIIGLDHITERCEHFREWLGRILGVARRTM